jgi:hypothetical protein
VYLFTVVVVVVMGGDGGGGWWWWWWCASFTPNLFMLYFRDVACMYILHILIGV